MLFPVKNMVFIVITESKTRISDNFVPEGRTHQPLLNPGANPTE